MNDRKVPHTDLAGVYRIVGCSDSAVSNHDVNIDLRADGKAALVYRVGRRSTNRFEFATPLPS